MADQLSLYLILILFNCKNTKKKMKTYKVFIYKGVRKPLFRCTKSPRNDILYTQNARRFKEIL
jgi:hypothetical protein